MPGRARPKRKLLLDYDETVTLVPVMRLCVERLATRNVGADGAKDIVRRFVESAQEKDYVKMKKAVDDACTGLNRDEIELIMKKFASELRGKYHRENANDTIDALKRFRDIKVTTVNFARLAELALGIEPEDVHGTRIIYDSNGVATGVDLVGADEKIKALGTMVNMGGEHLDFVADGKHDLVVAKMIRENYPAEGKYKGRTLMFFPVENDGKPVKPGDVDVTFLTNDFSVALGVLDKGELAQVKTKLGKKAALLLGECTYAKDNGTALGGVKVKHVDSIDANEYAGSITRGRDDAKTILKLRMEGK